MKNRAVAAAAGALAIVSLIWVAAVCAQTYRQFPAADIPGAILRATE